MGTEHQPKDYYTIANMVGTNTPHMWCLINFIVLVVNTCFFLERVRSKWIE